MSALQRALHLGWASLAAAIVVLVGARSALAHQVGLSSGTYLAAGNELRMEVTLSRREIAAAIPNLDENGDGAITGEELAAAKAEVTRVLADGLDVRAAGPCPRRVVSVELDEGDAMVARVVARCDGAASTMVLDFALVDALPFGHRHVAHIEGTAHPIDAVLYRGHRSVEISGIEGSASGMAPTTVAPASPGMSGLFWMGIEHILTGYDHLLFLFGLVLVGGRLRSLALAISAFTVAHSLTLALAALGIWTPSPRFVEPAIALSIAYVGVENYFVRDASKRWRITMPFGLIHGFGFAGALREVGLSRPEVPGALLSFNLGVEAGQLAVIALLVPLVLWARKRPGFEKAGVRLLNAAVVAAGVVWFVVRVAQLGA